MGSHRVTEVRYLHKKEAAEKKTRNINTKVVLK
jgi:hypothetical protein